MGLAHMQCHILELVQKSEILYFKWEQMSSDTASRWIN